MEFVQINSWSILQHTSCWRTSCDMCCTCKKLSAEIHLSLKHLLLGTQELRFWLTNTQAKLKKIAFQLAFLHLKPTRNRSTVCCTIDLQGFEGQVYKWRNSRGFLDGACFWQAGNTQTWLPQFYWNVVSVGLRLNFRLDTEDKGTSKTSIAGEVVIVFVSLVTEDSALSLC